MLNQIVNTVVPIFATAVASVLVGVIGVVGSHFVDYIEKKKEAVAVKVGVDKYNSVKNTALDIWHQVDEKFRITPALEKTFENKAAMFDKLLKAKIPSLTDSEIADIRQAIAGEINSTKEVVTSDAIAKQTELNSIKTKNAQLTAENVELKQKLTTIQNAAVTK